MIGSDSCEILEKNFQRIHRNMFGENPNEYGSANPASDINGVPSRLLRVVRWLNVTVLKECTDFPYLEMDESCMYLCSAVM